MKKRLFGVAVIAAVLCLSLCSCSPPVIIRTVDSLLTPPLYYSEYEGLVDSFHTSVGGNMILCSPIEGDNLSAITVTDLNGDGSEEGIIFYKDAVESEIAKFSVFVNEGETWKKSGSYTGYGNEIKSLILTDFDGDSCKDILVIWNYSGINGGSVFSVYRSATDHIEYDEVMFQSCDIIRPIDMDGDLKNEIFFISTLIDNNASTRSALLYKFDKTKFKEIGSAPVDPFVGSYISFCAESVGGNSPLTVYIDGVKTNNVVITEAISWDDSKSELTSFFYDEETGTNTATVRFEQIKCTDIDGDDLVEIPLQKPFDENVDSTDMLYVTEWTRYYGSRPHTVKRTYVNTEDGYAVDLDKLPVDEPFVRKQTGGDWSSWSVYTKGEDSPFDNTLFTIVDIPKERWEKEINSEKSGYVTILKKNESVICVKINTNGTDAGINADSIKKIVIQLPA